MSLFRFGFGSVGRRTDIDASDNGVSDVGLSADMAVASIAGLIHTTETAS